MTARVLVVDDISANRKLLEVRLTAEYFDVVTASSGHEAIDIAESSPCDIILLDVAMPGIDGFETCRRLKANPATHHIPVVMVTALDQPSDRLQGLEAGADDFLTKPVSDTALVTRVRSLARLKMMMDELRLRVTSSSDAGRDDPLAAAIQVSGENGRILVVDDREQSAATLSEKLSRHHDVSVEGNPQEALFRLAEADYEVAVIGLGLADFDALRLCSQIRSIERTRNLPILLLADPDDTARVLRGLDMGVNDYILRPIDHNELVARVATQIRRKRYADKLRDNVQASVAMALTDPLTGLHNRRYMESHLQTLVDQSTERGKPLSVMILDIDYFKSVNDSYGHDVGDAILKEFAQRLRRVIRGIDLACRFGGEEFVIVMPETDLQQATRVGERIRQTIGSDPFVMPDGEPVVEVTVSIGGTTLEREDDTQYTILKRADRALYAAKREGRNRVTIQAA